MGSFTPTPTPLVNSQMNQPQPPTEMLLGRYRVLARRGTGGFGTVCTCWDTRLQRRVAIKRMPLIGADADGDGESAPMNIGASTVDEVLLEARTASLLAHPNIVSVLDFEISGSYAYLIMEYVDGLNLAELLARVEGGRLTHEECAHILVSCARALAYAHENRVLHMDIKPTNIMIDRMGTVKLADLGMAELGAAAGYGGARGGTVGYMPPEQIEGMLVDERADVFSLACVLWQALTGDNPFMASNAAESLEQIYRGPRISGGSGKKNRGRSAAGETDLDLEIEDALVRALAPTASERTSSVEELVAELADALGNAEDGRASLAELIEQSERDDETDDAGWGRKHLAFHLRVPQAWAVAERAIPSVAVLACGVGAAGTLGATFGATTAACAASIAAAVALTALWPPIGSVLVGAAYAVAVATTSPVSSSFALASALGVALMAWWCAVGRDENMATASMLAPWAAGQPLAGAQLAGFCLDPVPALFTGAASYLIGAAAVACAQAGFSANIAADVVLITLERPSTWLFAAAAALAAWISSLVAMRGTVASGIVGQALGAGILAGSVILKVRVENGGIWGTPEWASLAVALICFLFMCILTVLRGPLYADQESEDSNELP